MFRPPQDPTIAAALEQAFQNKLPNAGPNYPAITTPQAAAPPAAGIDATIRDAFAPTGAPAASGPGLWPQQIAAPQQPNPWLNYVIPAIGAALTAAAPRRLGAGVQAGAGLINAAMTHQLAQQYRTQQANWEQARIDERTRADSAQIDLRNQIAAYKKAQEDALANKQAGDLAAAENTRVQLGLKRAFFENPGKDTGAAAIGGGAMDPVEVNKWLNPPGTKDNVALGQSVTSADGTVTVPRYDKNDMSRPVEWITAPTLKGQAPKPLTADTAQRMATSISDEMRRIEDGWGFDKNAPPARYNQLRDAYNLWWQKAQELSGAPAAPAAPAPAQPKPLTVPGLSPAGQAFVDKYTKGGQ
jgi:hypothetical protein